MESAEQSFVKKPNQNFLDFVLTNYGSLEYLADILRSCSEESLAFFDRLPTNSHLSLVKPAPSVTSDKLKRAISYAASGSYVPPAPPRPTYLENALYLTGTAKVLKYRGNLADTAAWATIEVDESTDSVLYPTATLALSPLDGTITVVSSGYVTGITIKGVGGNVLCYMPAVEGIGDGYNDILHNIYSNAANNYNNHFKLQNVILSTTWVKDVPRYTDPYLAGYSLESLGTNLVQGSTCEVIPKIANNGASVNATLSIINGQLNIIPTNTSGVYRAGRNTLSALHAYKLVIDVVSGTNPVQISLTNYVNDVTYPVTTFPQIAYTRYFRPLVAPENLNIRSFVIAVQPPRAIIDNFYFYRVLNNLLYGVKRPPHALLAGQDASNFTLTNPA